MYFDAHTHLNSEELYPKRKEHLKDFGKAGGVGLINIGVNHEYNTRGIEICKQLTTNDSTPEIGATSKSGRYSKRPYNSEVEDIIRDPKFPKTYCTIGLHPGEVVRGEIIESTIQTAIKHMCHLYAPFKEYIVGIGECGIDTHKKGSEDKIFLQKDLFGQQCDLARQWDLPVVIHSRANRKETYNVLRDYEDVTIYFHCRSYTVEEIKIIKKRFPKFYIGFCGNISYPKAEDIRKSLRYLVHENEDYPDHIISGKIDKNYSCDEFKTLDNLLIESDAPYLPPQSHRGENNSPALVVENYDYISALLGTSINEQVVNNTKRCYNISEDE